MKLEKQKATSKCLKHLHIRNNFRTKSTFLLRLMEECHEKKEYHKMRV